MTPIPGPHAAAHGIGDLFAAVLSDEPDLAALVQGGDVLTYRAWWAESGAAAARLADRGVGAGDIVALLLPSGRAFAVWYLAALRLGAVVSAVNPRLGPAETAHILAASRPVVTVTDTPERVTAWPVLDPAPGDGDGPVYVADGTDPAVIVWTTGTTGLPKGAWFDHRTLRFIGAHLGPLSAPYDRKLFPIPFAHSGYVTRLYDQLAHRAALILTDPVWHAADMLTTLQRERVTLGQGVPTQWEKLIALDGLEHADLSALRLVATGASRVSPELVRRLRERLPCPVVVRYASTEVPLAFGTSPDDAADTVARTVGRPLGGAEVQVRGPDGDALPAGEVGRVHLRSRAATRGYWNDPDRTAETLAPDGWLAASDLGTLDAAGRLTIVGRADDAYLRGGYNVYPSEVEAALAAHPGVDRVAVVGAPAPVIGEVGVAFVVADGPDEAELKDWCRARIADYKCPDAVVFVADLPVNAAFKVDVTELRRRAAELIAGSPRAAADR
ncbi:class I adenylate-forming enzyme family protein [Actinocorallia sp. A-T 12471]|uniref:class I adenylate-forming enzyme family protein n=1 Tax=Actinocorallia sp. A-T 12471 TaxID=3089813 RepID=UPI0029D1CF48|nr:AMP-binding protein [Actinocorallia sp. A-T 12471]MDX6740936.1 AMP-binding protein [Actinocorallia sp. A-T 12471]